MLELYERGVVRRFQPQRSQGSAPFHYVLGELGAYIVAGYYDLDLKRIKQRITSDQKLVHNSKLPHLLEVHDFFISLILGCREAPGHRLPRWWSESRCAKEWADGFSIRPDGQGILLGPHGRCSFLLELDRGTERGGQFAEKMKGFSWLAETKQLLSRNDPDQWPDVLLFLFPSENRERHARRHLFSYRNLCVATSHRELHRSDPLAGNWLPAQWTEPYGDADRIRLIDLPLLNRQDSEE